MVLASFGSVDGILRLLNTPEVPREPTKERTAASEGNAKGHGGSGASGRLLPVHTQCGEGKMIHAPQSRVTASRILTTPTKGLRTACAFAYGVVAHSRRLCSLDRANLLLFATSLLRPSSNDSMYFYNTVHTTRAGRGTVPLRRPFESAGPLADSRTPVRKSCAHQHAPLHALCLHTHARARRTLHYEDDVLHPTGPAHQEASIRLPAH